jgi:hypothetical protein
MPLVLIVIVIVVSVVTLRTHRAITDGRRLVSVELLVQVLIEVSIEIARSSPLGVRFISIRLTRPLGRRPFAAAARATTPPAAPTALARRPRRVSLWRLAVRRASFRTVPRARLLPVTARLG